MDRLTRSGYTVHLWNVYGGNGGFLETNGAGPAASKHEVVTNAYYKRAENVADWRISRA
ncbi:hypothetical protein [Streptomyces cyaneofuscatus]|uniref:hypothetical protein n=1 Tax=Streptomyces cyaneofuscatus TaxID=66883 RepID=UPI00365D43B0